MVRKLIIDFKKNAQMYFIKVRQISKPEESSQWRYAGIEASYQKHLHFGCELSN